MSYKDFPDGINIGVGADTFALVSGSQPKAARAIQAEHIKHQQFTNMVSVANVGGGEDALMSAVIAGADFLQIGSCIEFKAAGHSANTAGTKTIRVYIDAVAVATIVSAANAGLSWISEGEIVRETPALLHYHVRLFDCDGATGALGTQWAEFHGTAAVASGTGITLAFTGEAAGATTGDVDQDLLLLTHSE